VQRSQVPREQSRAHYRAKVAEITFIRKLSDPDHIKYTVQLGDNLWRIAQAQLIDPRIFIVLEDLNGIHDRPIWPGKTIELPQLADLCAQMLVDSTRVRPGDNLWAISNRRGHLISGATLNLRSGNPNLIFPYESVDQASAAH
jgi:hypothetical protein